MRAREFITDGLGYPVIVVDVQPAYDNPVNNDIVKFVAKQTGPVLMFINADETGLTDDTVPTVKEYWNDILSPEDERYSYDDETDEYIENPSHPAINWNRFTIVDKGYGYLRSWMDHGIDPAVIIATIREMYRQKVDDTRDLTPPLNQRIQDAIDEMGDDPLIVGWTSIAQLKRFNGAYIVGGGRDECLREVELLMNAFNVKYKRIDRLVYG